MIAQTKKNERLTEFLTATALILAALTVLFTPILCLTGLMGAITLIKGGLIILVWSIAIATIMTLK